MGLNVVDFPSSRMSYFVYLPVLRLFPNHKRKTMFRIRSVSGRPVRIFLHAGLTVT